MTTRAQWLSMTAEQKAKAREHGRVHAARKREDNDARLAGNKALRDWRAANPEKTDAQRAKFRPKMSAYQKAYQARNPEACNIRNRFASHQRNAPGRVTIDEWRAILEQFDNRCAYCGVRDKFAIEHVIPICRGGTNTPDNVVPACGSCNFVKGRNGPLALVNRNFALRTA